MTAGLACDLASVLVALDFDGTLAPITPHPEDARPLAGVHQVLRDVRATGAALAVVTGRSVSSLLRVSGFGAIPGIVVYGTHGAERWQAGSLRTAAAPPGLEELRETLPGLVAGIVRDPDVWVEDKRLSLVVHARLTAQPERVLGRQRQDDLPSRLRAEGSKIEAFFATSSSMVRRPTIRSSSAMRSWSRLL